MVLVDTNILVYAYDSNSPFNKKARAFLEERTEIKGEVCLAPQIILEFFGIITQKVRRPLKFSLALKLVREIKENKNILFIFPKETTILKTFDLAEKYHVLGRDIFDVYLVATMLDNGITAFYTHNTIDFTKFKEIEIFDPVI